MGAFNGESDSVRRQADSQGHSGADGNGGAEAAGRKPARPKAPVVLVHIPKTAGTSLTRILVRNETRTVVKLGNVFKGGGGVVSDPDYARKADAIAQAGS